MKSFEFKNNNFDLIRLLAALQVAFVHGYEHFGIHHNQWLISVLSIFPGVPIFFVVSGFLISASLERTSSIQSYVKNRFLRIYPALWGCFLISVLTIFIFFKPQCSATEFLKWVIAQVTIGQFYNPDFLRGYGVGVVNGSLWTIPVELQFYILLPFIYIIFNGIKWNKAFVAIFVIALVIANQIFVGLLTADQTLLLKLFGVTVLPYLYMFFFGVLLQRNLWFIVRFLENKALYVFAAYLLSALMFSFIGLKFQGNYINPISALILSFLTISLAYTRVDVFGRILKGNDISYGVYIYHMVVVNVFVQVAMFAPEINLVAMLVLTVILALLSWKFIEKPALSLKKYSINGNLNRPSAS